MKYLRYVMKTNLTGHAISWKTWPQEYKWVSWNESLLDTMAKLVFVALSSTTDAILFPRFKTMESCTESVVRMTSQGNFFSSGSGVISISTTTNKVYAGGIIGAILEDGTGWIQNVFVDPGFHGHGIGSLLLEHLLKTFIHNDIKNVGLHVTATNNPAIQLYSKYGFQIMETIIMEPKDL